LYAGCFTDLSWLNDWLHCGWSVETRSAFIGIDPTFAAHNTAARFETLRAICIVCRICAQDQRDRAVCGQFLPPTAAKTGE
jgi:hypothetical protein